jgi:phosphatidylserine/phosphatidylglycerophosphate/cardiolipin synthase-like enzyme
LIVSGQEAFIARAALAESAQRTLDLQYYIVAEDATATLLLYDTDIDLAYLSNGSRSRRYGIDSSRNLATGNDAALARAQSIAQGGYGQPNPGRN